MNAVKLTWLYLIENGYAGQVPYSNGMKVIDKHLAYRTYDPALFHDIYTNAIRTVGVDWANTEAPFPVVKTQIINGNAVESKFLVGAMVLNNNDVQTWSAPGSDSAVAREMFSNSDRVIEQLNFLFNENIQ